MMVRSLRIAAAVIAVAVFTSCALLWLASRLPDAVVVW